MSSQYEQRKNKRDEICRQSENEDVSCKNCKFFKGQAKSSFYCFSHAIYVRSGDVCDTFAEKPKPALKPTITEVLSQARKTSNFRQSYLSELKAGAYRV